MDCTRKWPVTTINDRFVFQFGALGEATEEEFFQGGERVEKISALFTAGTVKSEETERENEQQHHHHQ